MRISLRFLASLCCFSAPVLNARADVRLPALFSDHMVLQRGVPTPIWGWAEPGEEVRVSAAGQELTVKAGADGKWLVRLAPLQIGDPITITVQGKNTLTIHDALAGEVWLGSGQSNMEFTVNRANDFEQEKAAANFPAIRMFTVTRNPSTAPQNDCRGAWKVCSPETVGGFSAAAYFFGRAIHRQLKLPVGLINSSVGGTDIASWTSDEAQANLPEIKPLYDEWAKAEAAYDPSAAQVKYEKDLAAWPQLSQQAQAEGKTIPSKPAPPVQPRVDNNHPANLFNGMIAPLIPYAIKGAIWYQGEYNTYRNDRAHRYELQLKLLVQDWRTRWGYNFPFAWVQLPNYIPSGDGRALVREAMLHDLKLDQTGMAITIDIGEPRDNHPKNKQEVGRRLSLWALGSVYGEKVASTSGPLPSSSKIEGAEVKVQFTHADGGLVAKDGELKGFSIAGADQKWVKASARIEGDQVIVSSPDVPQPAAVRYAFEGYPDCNLYNGAGLPASPFRTDDWPVITKP